ncbi:hypothetical protein GGI35DRAFT_443321 [Trichoderma velutinum]
MDFSKLGNETIEGPIWRGRAVHIWTDYYIRLPKSLTAILLICRREYPEEGETTAPCISVRYNGLLLKRSDEDGPGAYVRLGVFTVEIPESEEEEDEGFLDDWETDVYLL